MVANAGRFFLGAFDFGDVPLGIVLHRFEVGLRGCRRVGDNMAKNVSSQRTWATVSADLSPFQISIVADSFARCDGAF